MEDFLDKMKLRYTVKKYNASQSVSPETIEKLKEILHLSPSSINSQPWLFTFVTSPDKKALFAPHSRHNAHKVEAATCIVIFQVMDNIGKFEQQIREYLPEGAVQYYNTMVKPHGEIYIRNWMSRQVYIALGVLLSACAEMDVDATPMEGIDTQQYDCILNHADYTTLVAVAIGVAAEDDLNRPSVTPKRRLPFERVVKEW